MSKVFTSKQFIEKLKWLVNDVPNYYYSGKLWLTYDKSKSKFRMDCVLSVKGILWGFSANKNDYRGGAKYESNGVADFTCNGGLTDHCSDISRDFKKLVPGEYLCMKGTKHNHTGIYLGNGKVFECTTAWGVNRCVISDIDSNGIRSYKGVKNLYWTYHGKLEYIDYSDSPEPIPTYYYYWSYDNKKNKWLPKVRLGSSDYAGNYGNGMSGLRVEDVDEYKVHDKVKGYWLPVVKGTYDYAGNLSNDIDGVAIKTGKYKYQVHIKTSNRWLPYVTGYNTKDKYNGYAGNIGETIDAIRIVNK